MYPRLEVQGLVNRFGPQLVHDGLNMQVAEDEVFGIVGASGSGKSVLLRTILGLQRPQAGVVRIDGSDITRSYVRGTGAPARRARSIILQTFCAFASDSEPPKTVKSCANT